MVLKDLRIQNVSLTFSRWVGFKDRIMILEFHRIGSLISQVLVTSNSFRYVGVITRLIGRFIHVIFADNSKGVRPVICLQYLYFYDDNFFADTYANIGNCGSFAIRWVSAILIG